MIPYYFDLDGVLRDFEWAVFGYRVSDWNQPIDGETDIWKYVDEHKPEVLEEAPPAKYYQAVLDFHKEHKLSLRILTHQPFHWRIPTLNWLRHHFLDIDWEVYFTETGADKKRFLEGNILFDDHPALVGHQHVITLDKLYNKKKDDDSSYIRISKGEEVTALLNYFLLEEASFEQFYSAFFLHAPTPSL